MKYYKSIFDKNIGGNDEIYYQETQDGWSIRQIIIDGNDWITSNVKYPQWGLVLGDKQIDFDSEPSATSISKQEFDEI